MVVHQQRCRGVSTAAGGGSGGGRWRRWCYNDGGGRWGATMAAAVAAEEGRRLGRVCAILNNIASTQDIYS